MNVAVLERFADPSRRYDPVRLTGAGDTTRLWDLPGPFHRPGELVRALPRAVAGWLDGSIPRAERRALWRACLSTGGARLGALVRAPELWARARAGEIDRVDCFSKKDFALAALLASRAGVDCVETLATRTQYFGEFAFELLAVIPYAYWLHCEGRLESTASTPDTSALYYFSPRHEEHPVPRRYVPITEYPLGEQGSLRYDRKAFPATLDQRRWRPPPYREVFRDHRFRYDREICVVGNKASDERYLWRGFAVNYMNVDLLLEVIGVLRRRFQVIYDRPRAADIVNDHQTMRELGDLAAVKQAYPDVLTIQELHAAHPELGFNELQLRLFAGCTRFVSVLGGGSYLASYFGGTNVVYARRGWEVACGAFERWFDRFSGARVVAAATPRQLLRAVERELLGGPDRT